MFSWQVLKVLAFGSLLISPFTCVIGADSEEEWLWSKQARGIWEEPQVTVPKVDQRRKKPVLPEQLYSSREAQLVGQVREAFNQGQPIEEVTETPVSYAGVTIRNGVRRGSHPEAVLASHYGQVAYRTRMIPGVLDLVVEPKELENGRALTFRRRVDFRLWTIPFGSDHRYDGKIKSRFSGSRQEGYIYFEKPF